MSDLQNRLSKALNRDINLNHEKVSDLIFELLQKVEKYQTDYQTTVQVIKKLLVEGQHGK